MCARIHQHAPAGDRGIGEPGVFRVGEVTGEAVAEAQCGADAPSAKAVRIASIFYVACRLRSVLECLL
jgi:hypothetical protein